MKKSKVNNDDAKYLLQKMIILSSAEVFEPHLWPSEIIRWKELVFALLTQTTQLPQISVRSVTDYLFELNLLNVEELALHLKEKRRAIDYDHPHARRIILSLQDGGFSRKEAERGLKIICKAAFTLSIQFKGKIQLYLRSYAERMVKEAQSIFHLSELDDRAMKYAFTLWLQNVLNMPLSLRDENVEIFSKANGLTSSQLFEAADEMDVNVALVDDLLYNFLLALEVSKIEPVDSH